MNLTKVTMFSKSNRVKSSIFGELLNLFFNIKKMFSKYFVVVERLFGASSTTTLLYTTRQLNLSYFSCFSKLGIYGVNLLNLYKIEVIYLHDPWEI